MSPLFPILLFFCSRTHLCSLFSTFLHYKLMDICRFVVIQVVHRGMTVVQLLECLRHTFYSNCSMAKCSINCIKMELTTKGKSLARSVIGINILYINWLYAIKDTSIFSFYLQCNFSWRTENHLQRDKRVHWAVEFRKREPFGRVKETRKKHHLPTNFSINRSN